MSTQAIRYPSHPWIWITSIWLGFGLVDAAQTVFVMRAEGMHHIWVKLFVVTVLFWVPWALATAPVVHLGQRFPPGNGAGLVGWLAHLAACAAIGLSFTAWTTWLERYFNLYVGSTDPLNTSFIVPNWYRKDRAFQFSYRTASLAGLIVNWSERFTSST